MKKILLSLWLEYSNDFLTWQQGFLKIIQRIEIMYFTLCKFIIFKIHKLYKNAWEIQNVYNLFAY